MRSYSSLWLAALAAVLLSSPWTPSEAQIATAYSRLFVFGDSLSDSGNVFESTHLIATAPYEPIPASPYAIGGHHFSNGATWVEQLAQGLGLSPSAKPALRQRGSFGNYAFGGARARMDGPVPGLGSQVDLFLADYGTGAPPDALYVVFIGSNDVRDALQALAVDPSGTTSNVIVQQALQIVGANIQRLWSAGARHILVANVPNIGATPAVRSLGAGAQALGDYLSSVFNAFLEANVLGPSEALPGIEIRRLDVYSALNAVVASPSFSNAVDPCLTFFVIGQAVCANPDRHLFWDAVHPTRAGHQVLAEAAAIAVAGP